MNKSSMIVLTGGLGNQLFQLSAAMTYGQNEIYLVTCLGEPDKLNGQLEIAKINFPKNIKFYNCNKNHFFSRKVYNFLLISGINEKTLNKKIFRKAILTLSSLVFSFHFFKFVYPRVNLGIGFDSTFATRSGNLFIGYFQTYLSANPVRQLLRNEVLRLHNYRNDFFDNTFTDIGIVVHYRGGDYRTEPAFGVLNQSYYLNSLKLLESLIDIKSISLFSNEPDFALNIIPSDFKEKSNVVENASTSPLSALLQMCCGQYFIIANSTFSWWAAFTSLHESKLVVAPEPWFLVGSDPQKLIPNEWMVAPR